MQLAAVLLLAALGSIPWGGRVDAQTRVRGIDLAAVARPWAEGLQALEPTQEKSAATTNSRWAASRLGYTGHQFDPETGLVYARARYYDAETGTFLSRDTYEGDISNAPSLHRFAYAWGNPLRFWDFTGHQSCTGPQAANPMVAALCSGNPQAVEAVLQAQGGTATVTAAPAAGATTTTAAGAAGEATVTATGAAGAATTTAETATAAVPWWKVAAASLIAAFTSDNSKEMTPAERQQAIDEAARRISQGTQDALDRGTKVAVEGSNGPGTAQAPITEPGRPEPRKLPGEDSAGKVVTEPGKGQPISAPGKGGAPQVAPGADDSRAPLYVSDAESGTLLRDPAEIRFSQDSIKGAFKDPRFGTINDLAEGLRSGRIRPTDIEPVRLVERDGKLITIDNRRLEAFRRAGVEIPTRMATPEEIAQAIRQGKFSAGEQGSETIKVRGER